MDPITTLGALTAISSLVVWAILPLRSLRRHARSRTGVPSKPIATGLAPVIELHPRSHDSPRRIASRS